MCVCQQDERRGERREACTDRGCMWRGGTARRTTEMLQSGGGGVGGGYHRSSRNNVKAGDRCFVGKEAERQTAEEDRARVTDIFLTPL